MQAERQADPQYELNELQHRRRVRLGDFADQVLVSGPTNAPNLTAHNALPRRPEVCAAAAGHLHPARRL